MCHWEHLADELHRLGYGYGYTRALVDGRLVCMVDARNSEHDFRVTARTRREAFEEILNRVRT